MDDLLQFTSTDRIKETSYFPSPEIISIIEVRLVSLQEFSSFIR